ncbi:MAG: transposase [Candidatus Symbiothrix sp.]|jgi:hypothetical protein|nr:transposase [Candidatus Symbiothrix sp.]
MGTKISNLSEIAPLISTKENLDEGVLGFIGQFKLGRLLKPYADFKKQGVGFISILTALILSRFGGMSVSAMQKTGIFGMDENTIYRMMNTPLINWKSIIFSFAKQFVRYTKEKGEEDPEQIKCFVLDDTEIPKTGKTTEGISKIYSHVKQVYLFGFKLLVFAFWDGKSLIPCAFSLHRESKDTDKAKNKNYGLKASEIKKQFHKDRPENSCGSKRFAELDKEKPSIILEMLKSACLHGFIASYVLMDSWFVSDFMIKGIRSLRKGRMHVIGMCKMDKRKFTVSGHEYNSQTIIAKTEVQKKELHTSRKYHSTYMIVHAEYKGVPVKLFYIKYKRATKWSLLLTTDLSLSFAKVMELYQIRWSIEVMFKECKQNLRLGKAQNTDFDGQVTDAALTLITYMIFALKKRFKDYETMGGLFRETQAKLLEATIYERVLCLFLEIMEKLLDILCIDIEETMNKIVADDTMANEIMFLLDAIYQRHNSLAKCEDVI